MIDLDAFLADVERRKRELGVIDSPEAIEALRNSGDRRSSRKRAMLARMEERAREAGRTPIPANY